MNEQTRPTRLREEDDRTTAEIAEARFHEHDRHQPPAVRAPEPEATASQLPSHTVPFAGGSFGKVVEAIANVMAEIRPVEKLGFNKFHNYAHMRIGDLNAELTPLMGKHGIVVIQNETRRDLFDNQTVMAIQYEFTILHKSGEVYPERPVITGVARCRTSKESWDDKTFNKCHTAARKYFLIGLFQIPVSDEDDADEHHGSDGPQRQRPTRRPPSPDGKATPDTVPIVDGEHPRAWAERFKKACGQSDTPATIQKWYQANIAIFEKMKRFADEDSKTAGMDIYNGLIDFMDQLEVKLTGKQERKDDPISTGPQEPPAEKKQATRRRAAPPPPAEEPANPAGKLYTDEEEQWWHESLENAFGACEDAVSLAEAQTKHMTPRQKNVSEAAWREALAITRRHLKRIEEGEAS